MDELEQELREINARLAYIRGKRLALDLRYCWYLGAKYCLGEGLIILGITWYLLS